MLKRMRKERKKKENGMKMPFDIYFSPPGIYTKGVILEKTGLRFEYRLRRTAFYLF